MGFHDSHFLRVNAGNVSIRGRIIKGMVVSTKMNRTLIIRRDYLHWVSKYKR
jgi:small subunit ribosomal protein S11e